MQGRIAHRPETRRANLEFAVLARDGHLAMPREGRAVTGQRCAVSTKVTPF